MMNRRHVLAATLMAATALLAPPLAAQVTPASLTPQDQADLRRIESYLNSLTTVQAEFVQVSNGANYATGIFYLKRPGRMRLEYDPPVPYLYIADGTWLTFFDRELDQRSDVLLGSSIADFITRSNVTLSGDVTVTGIQRSEGRIGVELVQTSDPGAGRLTLNFQLDPLLLTSWTVLDAQGTRTQVDLTGLTQGVALDNSLFVTPQSGPSAAGGR